MRCVQVRASACKGGKLTIPSATLPGYNPCYYDDGYGYDSPQVYVAPAMQYQVQHSKTPPTVKFKEYKIQVVREAVTAPPAPQTFNVQVPPGVMPGQQMNVTNPFNGQQMMVVLPAGLAPGALFQVAAAAPAQPQRPAGGAVGQLMPVDTTGDGVNDSFGVLSDRDGDGVPDAIAVDHNNDGIVDQYLPYTAPGGQQANLKVNKMGVDHLVVTAPVSRCGTHRCSPRQSCSQSVAAAAAAATAAVVVVVVVVVVAVAAAVVVTPSTATVIFSDAPASYLPARQMSP